MKCPRCVDVTMLMSEKSGVEVDYCPECRGVWLDRGELDKILERTGGSHDRKDSINEMHHDDSHYKHKSEHQYGHDYKDHHKKHHKKSFWKDLFDF